MIIVPVPANEDDGLTFADLLAACHKGGRVAVPSDLLRAMVQRIVMGNEKNAAARVALTVLPMRKGDDDEPTNDRG